MLTFKKTSKYPNYSLYVLVGGVLKIFGGFSKRMEFSTAEEAKDYLKRKRYLAGQSSLAKTPVLLVRYDAPYDSVMVEIL